MQQVVGCIATNLRSDSSERARMSVHWAGLVLGFVETHPWAENGHITGPYRVSFRGAGINDLVEKGLVLAHNYEEESAQIPVSLSSPSTSKTVMSTQHLDIDDEDFCMDMIPKIETSFGFHFEQHDLEYVSTFGELCQVVLAKIPGHNVLDCTTQQAFYRIREAFKTQLPAVAITPSTRLADLLPAESHKRRKTVAAVEAELGVKLNVLDNAAIAQITGLLLLLLGFGATMFFDRQIGGMGLAFTFDFFISLAN